MSGSAYNYTIAVKFLHIYCVAVIFHLMLIFICFLLCLFIYLFIYVFICLFIIFRFITFILR